MTINQMCINHDAEDMDHRKGPEPWLLDVCDGFSRNVLVKAVSVMLAWLAEELELWLDHLRDNLLNSQMSNVNVQDMFAVRSEVNYQTI